MCGGGGNGGRAANLRRENARNLRIAENRAKINSIFGFTDKGAFSVTDPNAARRKQLQDSIAQAKAHPNSSSQSVESYQQQLKLLGPAIDTSGYAAAGVKNKAAREAMLTGPGGQRSHIMDYFNNEINRQRQLARKNIDLTMARRGRSTAPAMMDLNNATVRQQAKFGSQADNIIQGVRNADTAARVRLINALTGTGNQAAAISGAQSALNTDVKNINAEQNRVNMADLFSKFNSAYGQQGVQAAYLRGQKSVNIAPGSSGGAKTILNPYG